MNEIAPEPASRSRSKSEAKAENEKAVPMTRNTRQNTAATTRGPEVVDNTPRLRQATAQTPCDGFRAAALIPCALFPAFFVLTGTPSKKARQKGGLSSKVLSTAGGFVAMDLPLLGD